MTDHQLEVGRSKLPMSAYDLLGYIVPGTTLLITVFLLEFEAREQLHIPIVAPLYSSLFNLWPTMSGADGHWLLGVVFLVLLVAAAYVCGHLVSSVSSFLVDRVFIHKGYGYPYEHLLRIGKTDPGRDPSRAFYRGTCFWVNAYFVLRACDLLWPSAWTLVFSHIVGYYAVGVFLLRLASFGSSKATYRNGFRWLDRFMCRVHSLPYEAVARPLSRILGTKAELPVPFVDLYRILFHKRFGVQSEEAGTGNFWLAYSYVPSESPALGGLLSNWFRLYSFARNLSVAFYLAFLYGFSSFSLQSRAFPSSVPFPLAAICGAYLFLSGVFLVRYVFLYVSYFTKFTFRAFVVVESIRQPLASLQSSDSAPIPSAAA